MGNWVDEKRPRKKFELRLKLAELNSLKKMEPARVCDFANHVV